MDIDGASPKAEPVTSRPGFSQRVLHAFFTDGRLTGIPAKERKRQVILRHLAATDFEDGRDYPEREVNQRLALRHRDVAALRRYLVDGRYLARQKGIYRRTPMVDWPADPGDAGVRQPRPAASPDE